MPIPDFTKKPYVWSSDKHVWDNLVGDFESLWNSVATFNPPNKGNLLFVGLLREIVEFAHNLGYPLREELKASDPSFAQYDLMFEELLPRLGKLYSERDCIQYRGPRPHENVFYRCAKGVPSLVVENDFLILHPDVLYCHVRAIVERNRRFA